MKYWMIKLGFGILFLAFLFIPFKEVKAADATDPGYYGYKSRKVVTESLNKHTEIPVTKRTALINMLSKDGYFWMKTKQEKLNYIHANLPSAQYLSIVADAENIHSWTVQPATSKTVSYSSSKSSKKTALKVTNKKTNEKIVNIKGVKFVIKGWTAQKAYNLDDSIYKGMADRIIWLRKRVSGMYKEQPPAPMTNQVEFHPKLLMEEVDVLTGWQANVYANGNIMEIGFPIGMSAFDVPFLRDRVVTHEFGHMIYASGWIFVGKDQALKKKWEWSPELYDKHWNLMSNRNSYYNAWMDNSDLSKYFSDDAILGEHPYSNDNELWATFFSTYYLPNHDKWIKNPPKKFKPDKLWNINSFGWEVMATWIDGNSPSQHPFTHKPILKEYTVQEIYDGKFWNE